MEPLSAGERGGQRYVPIGNEDKPLPEGEEGVVEEERGIALDRLSPKVLAGFTISSAMSPCSPSSSCFRTELLTLSLRLAAHQLLVILPPFPPPCRPPF